MNKSNRYSRALRHLVFTAAVLALPIASSAQGVNLASGLTDFTNWTLFGTATATNATPGNGFTYSNLSLTVPGIQDSAGAGFAPEAILLDFDQPFSFNFHFFIAPGENERGDGFTFTFGSSFGLGGGGSGLGYDGLPADTVAFAIDTFHFDNSEPASPSIQILSGASVIPLVFTETGLGTSIRDPNFQWLGTVSFLPSGNDDESDTLTGTIEHLNLGTFSVSAVVDLSGFGGLVDDVHEVYYGFTGSSGLADGGHVVTSAAPVPLPAAVWVLGSAVLGIRLGRRRQGRDFLIRNWGTAIYSNGRKYRTCPVEHPCYHLASPDAVDSRNDHDDPITSG